MPLVDPRRVDPGGVVARRAADRDDRFVEVEALDGGLRHRHHAALPRRGFDQSGEDLERQREASEQERTGGLRGRLLDAEVRVVDVRAGRASEILDLVEAVGQLDELAMPRRDVRIVNDDVAAVRVAAEDERRTFRGRPLDGDDQRSDARIAHPQRRRSEIDVVLEGDDALLDALAAQIRAVGRSEIGDEEPALRIARNLRVTRRDDRVLDDDRVAGLTADRDLAVRGATAARRRAVDRLRGQPCLAERSHRILRTHRDRALGHGPAGAGGLTGLHRMAGWCTGMARRLAGVARRSPEL